MTPADYRVKDTAQKLKQKYRENIDIQYIQESLETLSLSVEVKDDSKETANDMAIGLATHSNSRSTVLSYASMFEGFWKQAEIYEQLRESKIQLNNTRNELDDMKKYVNEALKEVHNKRR